MDVFFNSPSNFTGQIYSKVAVNSGVADDLGLL